MKPSAVQGKITSETPAPALTDPGRGPTIEEWNVTNDTQWPDGWPGGYQIVPYGIGSPFAGAVLCLCVSDAVVCDYHDALRALDEWVGPTA